MAESDNILTELQDLLLYLIPQLNKFPRDQKFVPANAPMTVRDLMEKTNGMKPREARAAAAIYF
jgi:hypothetical protein